MVLKTLGFIALVLVGLYIYFSEHEVNATCSRCQGTGTHGDGICPNCQGTGHK
ncbi:hypothetical protein Arno162_146 [Pectobacterium phage Arno162]|uniref:Uncharacterized protein n=2 Tax=Arnovirus TaxID=3425109 RepID=A0A678ZXL7_9CAUD|nr:hypothetical protein Arno162_146 [Pectobacterium phage Arno162]AZV02333.1 hypothetical protein Arno18_147 [Pectobacterium phage Arno18]